MRDENGIKRTDRELTEQEVLDLVELRYLQACALEKANEDGRPVLTNDDGEADPYAMLTEAELEEALRALVPPEH